MNTNANEIRLPELGEGVTEGELVKWLVKPGDSVKPDQAVAEIMTDKATVEVPSPVAGVVKDLKFKVGDVIKIENVIITLSGSSSASMPSAPAANSTATATTTAAISKSQSAAAVPAAVVSASMTAKTTSAANSAISAADVFPPVADAKVLATPSTRRLAREVNVDINQLSGTGLAGRVTREDVLANADSASGAAATVSGSMGGASATMVGKTLGAVPRLAFQSSADLKSLEERIPLRGIRKKIAENLQMAKQIIPHFTLADEADVTALVQLRASLKDVAEQEGTKITYLPFVMKALISASRSFPMFNASIDDASQEIVYKKYFNIGFAADTPNGLVVPVIKNADQKTILQISKEILDLSKRARDGKLKPDEMKNATITITNIGSVGGTFATPIINHPEVAILGMYKISDKLVLDAKNQVTVTKSMNFTITADHRLIDGAVAANFLKLFISKMQSPGVLMMDMI